MNDMFGPMSTKSDSTWTWHLKCRWRWACRLTCFHSHYVWGLKQDMLSSAWLGEVRDLWELEVFSTFLGISSHSATRYARYSARSIWPSCQKKHVVKICQNQHGKAYRNIDITTRKKWCAKNYHFWGITKALAPAIIDRPEMLFILPSL